MGKLTRSSVTAEVAHVVPVIHMLPKAGSLDYIFVVDSMSLASVSLTQLAPKAAVLGETTRNDGSSGSLKVIGFGADRKPVCDLLLVNNTNLYPVSHRFRYRGYWSNCHFHRGCLLAAI